LFSNDLFGFIFLLFFLLITRFRHLLNADDLTPAKWTFATHLVQLYGILFAEAVSARH
jgi:hypothetical protein